MFLGQLVFIRQQFYTFIIDIVINIILHVKSKHQIIGPKLIP
jgi:hypothetical protein